MDLCTLGLFFPTNTTLLPKLPQSFVGEGFLTLISDRKEDCTKYWRQSEGWERWISQRVKYVMKKPKH